MHPVVIIAAGGLAYAWWKRGKRSGRNEPTIATDEVIASIQTGLVRAIGELYGLDGFNELPSLQSVTLTLQTLESVNANGTVSVSVASGGVGRTREDAHSLTVQLVPPTEDQLQELSSQVNLETIASKHITSTIVATVQGVVTSGRKYSLASVASFTIAMSFAITRDAQAQVGISVSSVNLGGFTSKSDRNSHSLVLDFRR